MEEEPKYSKELKDLEERIFQKAKSDKEEAKVGIDKRIESFHQKRILGEGVGLVGGEKEKLQKKVRESLYNKYVDIHSKRAKEIEENLREVKHKLDDHETDMRRALDKIKTLLDKELRDEYLEAEKCIEHEKKLGRE